MAGLLDFIQGASNAAASNVSAPVDGIAWLLRKAGLPVPAAPVGGSDWMAQKGLTKPTNGVAGLLGESVGGVLPIVAQAGAPQIAKGLLSMGDNLAAPSNLHKQAGALYIPLSDEVDRARALAQSRVIDFGDGRSVTITPARNSFGPRELNADVSFSNATANRRTTYPAGSNFSDSQVSSFLSSPGEISKVRVARSQIASAKNDLSDYIQAQRELIRQSEDVASVPHWAEQLTTIGNTNPAGPEWWKRATKNNDWASMQAFADSAKESGLMKFGNSSKSKSPVDIAKHYGIDAVESNGGLLFKGDNGALQVYNADGESPFIRSIAANSSGKESGGGNKLYQAAMNWAANNGKVFAVDPAGITPINEVRKLGNELSSQIRNGVPTAAMNSPGINGISGLGEVWQAESRLSRSRVPSIKDIAFDGQSFNMSDADIVRVISSKDPKFSKGVGLMTAKRSAIADWIKSNQITPEAAKLAAAALAAAGSGPIFARDQ